MLPLRMLVPVKRVDYWNEIAENLDRMTFLHQRKSLGTAVRMIPSKNEALPLETEPFPLEIEPLPLETLTFLLRRVRWNSTCKLMTCGG